MSSQIIFFTGESLGSAVKMMSSVRENGYDAQNFLEVVSEQIQGQTGGQKIISGGHEVAGHSGFQSVGTGQNSGREL